MLDTRLLDFRLDERGKIKDGPTLSRTPQTPWPRVFPRLA